MFKYSQTLLAKEIKNKRIKDNLKVYDAGLGESPFGAPQSLKDQLIKYSHKKEYTNTKGILELQEKLGKKIIVGNGLKPLIFVLQLTFSKMYPNGTIYHILPAWVSYLEHTNILQCNQIGIETTSKENWKLTPKKLEEEFSKNKNGKKFIIFNNPTNPTGQLYTDFEVKELSKVFNKYNCIIFADRIYEGLVFPAYDEVFGNLKKYSNKVITGSSLSKELGCGGYRLGWLVFPENELKDFYDNCSSIAISTYSCPSIILQYVALKGLEYPDDIKEQVKFQKEMFEKIGSKITDKLKLTKLKYSTPQASWYIWIDFENYKEELNKLNIKTSSDLSNYLGNTFGIIVVPGQAFGDKSLSIRLSFVAIKNININTKEYDDGIIMECMDILISWISKL